MSFEVGGKVYLDGPADLYIVVSQSRVLTPLNFLKRIGENYEVDCEHVRSVDEQSVESDQSWEPLARSDLPEYVDVPAWDKTLSLGLYRGQICGLIVLDIECSSPAHSVSNSVPGNALGTPGYAWCGLRALLPIMTNDTFLLVSRALQLYVWDKDHRFCGRCGASTQPPKLDRAWGCTSCDLLFYPRISPCVIGIVTDGPRILLARGMKHNPGLFSCLAGFIEPGENAEQAFAREVKEEVNLEIKNIRYYGSQPWPFPGQLMLGFYADISGGELQVDGVEILEANWYTKDNLPILPSAYSIAGTMIRDYLQCV